MAYRKPNSVIYAFDYIADATVNTANGAMTLLNANSGVGSLSPIGGRDSIMNDTTDFSAGDATGCRIGTMGYTASSTYQQIKINALYANMVQDNDSTTMYDIFGGGNDCQM
jgi:hypothetical protein